MSSGQPVRSPCAPWSPRSWPLYALELLRAASFDANPIHGSPPDGPGRPWPRKTFSAARDRSIWRERCAVCSRSRTSRSLRPGRPSRICRGGGALPGRDHPISSRAHWKARVSSPQHFRAIPKAICVPVPDLLLPPASGPRQGLTAPRGREVTQIAPRATERVYLLASLSLAARIWPGEVPQHPPTSRAPASSQRAV